MVGLAREVVGRLERTSDALLDGSISTVVGAEDRVLEATWVLNIDVELAVLALLGKSDTGADGGNVRVEDERDEGLISRKLVAQSALRASSSTVLDAADGNL